MFKRLVVLFNSLKIRIIFSAFLMGLILMPVVGFTISNAYERHMNASIKNELKAYSYSILAVTEIENNQLLMPEYLLENQFNVNHSGLYAFFSSAEKLNKQQLPILWQSASLLTVARPKELKLPGFGENFYYTTQLESEEHFIYSFTVNFDGEQHSVPATLHIVKEREEIKSLLSDFQQKLWIVLFVLMIVLFGVQLVWLTWSLKPLSHLKEELSDIEQGEAESLKHTYPKELQQVTQQLNTLLKAEQNQRLRYRNALSDLAHSLKTPLAVIKSQQNLSSSINTQLDTMDKMVEHQLKRAQSAGSASWHKGTQVELCVDKLVSSLTKIYHDKSLSFHVDVSTEVIFQGDETDLFEIIGNLLDNSCKAAKNKIIVSAFYTPNPRNVLQIIVEDDGEGVKSEVQAAILQRGVRADTYEQGHGIGLAIVRDLVESYQGTLEITQSEALLGAKFTITL